MMLSRKEWRRVAFECQYSPRWGGYERLWLAERIHFALVDKPRGAFVSVRLPAELYRMARTITRSWREK